MAENALRMVASQHCRLPLPIPQPGPGSALKSILAIRHAGPKPPFERSAGGRLRLDFAADESLISSNPASP